MKRFISVIALVFALVMLFAVPASAFKPYQTYTYSIDGFALHSPDAYTPIRTVDSAYMGLEVPFDEPSDIVVDENDNVYLVDSKNGRIIVLDRYFKLKMEISTFINDQGVDDAINVAAGQEVGFQLADGQLQAGLVGLDHGVNQALGLHAADLHAHQGADGDVHAAGQGADPQAQGHEAQEDAQQDENQCDDANDVDDRIHTIFLPFPN